MSDNKVSEILKDIVGELKNIATSQTVIGDPISIKEKTVVPVVKISIGFGAGGGQGQSNEQSGFGAHNRIADVVPVQARKERAVVGL